MSEPAAILFEPLSVKHQAGVMKIFNEYVETTTSAFPPDTLPESFYEMILKRTEGYPAYALIGGEERNSVVGFCFLASYNPFSTFKTAANITCFIEKNHTGQGVGKRCLHKLEEDALRMGICHLIADISSENEKSIRFHRQNGFEFAGELKRIGQKLNRIFSIVYMQKEL